MFCPPCSLTFDFFNSPGYSVRCTVGTPPQELFLQLDTGRADTSVPSSRQASDRHPKVLTIFSRLYLAQLDRRQQRCQQPPE
jgi:hypothetical protein